MIVYKLICKNGHVYESWFKNSHVFDELKTAGHLVCEICGNDQVSKAIMAPQIVRSKQDATTLKSKNAHIKEKDIKDTNVKTDQKHMDSMMDEYSKVRQHLCVLRAYVETNFDNVGDKFAEEVRAIASGEAEERSVYGRVNAKEMKSLLEEGIEVIPLQTTHRDS